MTEEQEQQMREFTFAYTKRLVELLDLPRNQAMVLVSLASGTMLAVLMETPPIPAVSAQVGEMINEALAQVYGAQPAKSRQLQA